MTRDEQTLVRMLAAFDRVQAGLREFHRVFVRWTAVLDQAHTALRAVSRGRR